MNAPAQIAKNLRDAYFGGNWTASSMKEHLSDLTWQEAIAQVHGFNTIAKLVFHTNYYVTIAIKVLEGGPLQGSDKFAFDVPPIQSQEDWEQLLNKSWSDAEKLAGLIEQLPEDKIWAAFDEGKYGNYFRNLVGIIEHVHYHLGQMVLIRKLVRRNQ